MAFCRLCANAVTQIHSRRQNRTSFMAFLFADYLTATVGCTTDCPAFRPAGPRTSHRKVRKAAGCRKPIMMKIAEYEKCWTTYPVSEVKIAPPIPLPNAAIPATEPTTCFG